MSADRRPAYIFFNSGIVHRTQASISVYDRGFLYGDGVFETIRTYDGWPYALEEHLHRLHSSAHALKIPIPDPLSSSATILPIVQELLQANSLSDATIRVVVTRGENEDLGYSPLLAGSPSVIIMLRPIPENIADIQANGVRVVISSVVRNFHQALNPAIKSVNLLNNMLASFDAEAAGAYEALMRGYHHDIVEGTRSNLFLVRNGDVITPPLSAGILNGVTRSTVLGLCDLGSPINHLELFVKSEDLIAADEVFLTHTTMEIVPVTSVDDHRYPDDRPVTRILQSRFRRLIDASLAVRS